MGPTLVVGAAAGCAAAAVLALTMAAGAGNPTTGAPAVLDGVARSVCVVSGPVGGLSAAQAANAETVVAVAQSMSTAHGADGQAVAEIAVMTAITESDLEDLGPEPGNAGSLGLFQQRATQGWGTPAQEENPTDATAMFVTRLLTVPDWQVVPPWVAAQRVQRSAFSDGSNYQAHWPDGLAVVAAIDGQAGGVECGTGSGGPPAGPAARWGLPDGYTIPAAADIAEATAVTYAIGQLGKPYVWGAAGPAVFDCSGLTEAAWAASGVQLAHYTGDQLREGAAVTGLAVAGSAAMSPGDLVLVPGADGTLAAPGHVGVYLGYGLVESAVDPQQGVIVQTWTAFTAGGLSGVRHIA